ncbi:MAG: DUF420 domain-containing protein [Nitrososphaerales archaeon]
MGVTPPPGSVVNLYLQLFILVVLAIGVVFAKRRSFQIHERIMGLAIIFAVFSLVSWMAVSLIENFNALTASPFSIGSLITISHVIFGASAAALTVGILYKRITASSLLQFRAKSRKTLMRTTLLLWLITFTLGAIFYLLYFVL